MPSLLKVSEPKEARELFGDQFNHELSQEISRLLRENAAFTKGLRFEVTNEAGQVLIDFTRRDGKGLTEKQRAAVNREVNKHLHKAITNTIKKTMEGALM